MRALRVLLFAPHFAPFANPEAFVANKFVLAALEAGWDVEVVSRNYRGVLGYDYGSGWVEPWLSLRRRCFEISYPVRRQPARSVAAAYSAIRLGHPIEGCRWARHAVDLAWERHSINPYDVIISRSTPDSAHLAGLAMVRRAGLPWVASFNDPSVEVSDDSFASAVGPPFFHRRFLQRVVERASWLTFPSARMRSFVCRYLGERALSKSSVVPHTAMDWPAFEPWKRAEKFTLCHAGYIGEQRKPHTLLEGLARFAQASGADRNVRLRVIGLENPGLLDLARSFGVDDLIDFTGPLSYGESLRALQRSDVLVVLEAPVREGIYLPAKTVDYVQVGRPILAVSPRQGTLSDTLNEHGGGVAADCQLATSVEKAIFELHDHWRKGSLEQAYGSRRLMPLFSKKLTIELYGEIFERIAVLCSNVTATR